MAEQKLSRGHNKGMNWRQRRRKKLRKPPERGFRGKPRRF